MNTKLVIRESDWDVIGQALFDDRTEHMVVAGAGISRCEGQQRILLRQLFLPEAERDYEFQGPAGVSLRADAVAKIMEAMRGYPVLIDMHNHVWNNPSFSRTDDAGVPPQWRVLQDFSRGAVLLQLVFGPDGSFLGRWTDPGFYPCWKLLDQIQVIGGSGIQCFSPWNQKANADTDDLAVHWLDRHLRTLPILGKRSLIDVARTRIGIVGLGGTGSAFLSIGKFFFPHLVLVDDDAVETSNLGRLVGAVSSDAASRRQKVGVSARELRRFDERIDVRTCASRFPTEASEEILKACDVIVCCVDNDLARYHLAEFAARHGKTLVEMGSGVQMEDGVVCAMGCQVRLQIPGGPCLACLNLPVEDLEFESTTEAKIESGYLEGTALTPGEVVSTNMMAATLALRNLLTYLGGHLPRPVPTYLFYDETRPCIVDFSAEYPKRAECPICGSGESGIGAWGDHLPDRLQLAVPTDTEEFYESD